MCGTLNSWNGCCGFRHFTRASTDTGVSGERVRFISEQTIPSTKSTELRTHLSGQVRCAADTKYLMVRSNKVKANGSEAHNTQNTHRRTPKIPCRDTERRGRADSAGIDHRGLLVFMSPLSRLSPLHSCVLTHTGSIIAPPRPRSDMKVPWCVWMCARRAAAARSETAGRERGVCHPQPA